MVVRRANNLLPKPPVQARIRAMHVLEVHAEYTRRVRYDILPRMVPTKTTPGEG